MKKSTLLCLFIFLGASFAFSQIPKPHVIQLASGLEHPIDIQNCGDERLFFIEQKGQIRIMNKAGNIMPEPFLDIDSIVLSTGTEQGLLGLAFSPNYAQDGFLFVNFTTGTGNGTTVVARYSIDPLNPNKALPSSKKTILEIPQPGTTHNGGNLIFGPDGFLYIFTGDGGGGNNSQNLMSLHSKILRIDPFSDSPYAIPTDNPYFGALSVRNEIWAGGLRNPWRNAFDKLTGDLWIADVGQEKFEEINFQSANSGGGENYGWRCYEGNSVFSPTGCQPIANYDFPIFEYAHNPTNGCSVTGGFVYRGAQFARFFGKYLFTDACSAKLWATTQTGGAFTTDSIGKLPKFNFVTFGQDNEGELYLGSFALMEPGTGKIWKLTDTSSCLPVAFFSFQDTIKTTAQSIELIALSGTGLTFQWALNGIDIPGATAPVFIADQSGWYTVKVSKGNCTNISTATFLKFESQSPIKDLHAASFRIFPNPTDGFAKIEAPASFEIGEIRVFDAFGRLVLVSKNAEIDLADYPEGIYFLKISGKNGPVTGQTIQKVTN
jgi:glucose/arabinose dehydrogenase